MQQSENLPNASDSFPQDTTEEPISTEDENIININLHHDAGVLNCTLCIDNDTKLTSAKEMRKHLWNIHKEKFFNCDLCDEQFHHKFQILKHMTKIHGPKSKNSKNKWECGECKKKFASYSALQQHEYAHDGVKLYECNYCGKTLISKNSLQVHEKRHELIRERSYCCATCGKSFFTKQNLQQHEETHKKIKQFACTLCDNRSFTTENNLSSHMIVHEENKPFLCTFSNEDGACGKRFSRKVELRDHVRIHTGERPYVCLTCGAMFAQRSNLQSHVKATHYNVKNNICDICGKGFKRKRLLTYHKNSVHTKERPHKCTECEKDFVYPDLLNRHKVIAHQQKSPFLCNICDKNFSTSENYNYHLYSHTNKKRFECITCHAEFNRKDLFKNHIDKTQHYEDTYIFNRIEQQISSDDIPEENSCGVMIFPEVRAMDKTIHIQSIPTVQTNQYYQNMESQPENQSTVLGEILQFDHGNHEAPLEEPTEGSSNNNEIVDMPMDMNMLLNESGYHQVAVKVNNEIQYILYEIVPDP